MPDQDDASNHDHDGPAQEDHGLAAERLERALERIAASAHRAASLGAVPGGRQPAGEPIMDPGPTREVAVRLDALIIQLRNALDRD